VEFAERLAFMLKVLALDECLSTNTAFETLWMPGTHQRCDRTANYRLSTSGTNCLDELVEAGIAVVLSIVLFAVSTSEFTTTRLTTVVLRMDFLSIDNDVFSHNGLLALGANLVLCVTDLDTNGLAFETERISFIFFVLDTQKALSTLSTGKVVGMIDTVTETNALANHRLFAGKAAFSKELVEALFTVVLTVLLHEGFCFVDATMAVVALETLRMVAPLAHRKDLSDNRLAAKSTGRSGECQLVAIGVCGRKVHLLLARTTAHHSTRPTRHSTRSTTHHSTRSR